MCTRGGKKYFTQLCHRILFFTSGSENKRDMKILNLQRLHRELLVSALLFRTSFKTTLHFFFSSTYTFYSFSAVKVETNCSLWAKPPFLSYTIFAPFAHPPTVQPNGSSQLSIATAIPNFKKVFHQHFVRLFVFRTYPQIQSGRLSSNWNNTKTRFSINTQQQL